MNALPILAPLALMLAAVASAQVPAADGMPPAPEAALVRTHCTSCHGLDLVTKQPRGKGEDFWAEQVDRMVDTHGAEIANEDRRAIVAYLARAFR